MPSILEQASQTLIAWMVVSVVIGSLLGFAALAVERIVRRSVPFRAVWFSALALTVLLSLTLPFRTSVTTTNPDTTTGADNRSELLQSVPNRQSFLSTITDAASRIPYLGLDAIHTVSSATSRKMAAAPAWVQIGLLFFWPLVSATLLIIGIASYRKYLTAVRSADEVALHNDIVRVAQVPSPMAIGLVNPMMVVPPSVLTKSEEEQLLILAHEKSHINARDPLLLAAAHTIAALMPWNPMVWFMLSRLRLAIELDCDSRVLRSGASLREYSKLLLDFSAHAARESYGRPISSLTTALSWRTSQLQRRINAMTDRSRTTLFQKALATAVASTALFAACRSDLPTAAQIDALDVKSADRELVVLGQPSILTADSTTFIVDGQKVGREVATSISADSIKLISLQKNPSDKNSTVLIVTGAKPLMKGEAQPARPTGNIRGVMTNDSTSAASRPIVFVDGVRISTAEMNKIRPQDIQSVEVIKGAAATRDYGSDGANGVINIQTKKK